MSDESPVLDPRDFVPRCPECCEATRRVGSVFTRQKALPLYQCLQCRGDAIALGAELTDALGLVIEGRAYKLGPNGERIRVAHPDDVWG